MTTKEKLGVGIFFVAGTIIGLSPFAKGILYDFGVAVDLEPIRPDGWARVTIGFFFVFGAKYFNSISSTIGDGIKEKFGNKKEIK